MNKSDKLFSTIFNNFPTGVAYTNHTDGKIIDCNESWLELYGFTSKDEVLGKSMAELNLLFEESQRDLLVKLVIQSTKSQFFERPVKKKNGQRFWVSTSVISTFVDSLPVLVFATIDITKRKDAEEALAKLNDVLEQKYLEKNEELIKSDWGLKMAQEISHTGNWEYDLITHNSDWSDETYRIFGFEVGGVAPTLENYLATIHPEDIEYVRVSIDDSFKTFIPAHFIHRSYRKDGTLIYIYAESRFRFDADGKPASIYGIMQNITDTKLYEEMLTSKNKSLLEIASLQSHQVRKPIAQILGLLSLLDMENLGSEANKEVLQKLKETAKACDEVIYEISEKTKEIERMKNV